MRREDKEIIETQKIEDILRQGRICRLGLWDGQSPYLVTLCYGYRAPNLYFHGAKEGQKLDILKKNNQVAFAVEIEGEIVPHAKPCAWSLAYLSCHGRGEAFFIEDATDKEDALKVIMAQYGKTDVCFSLEQIQAVTVWKVTITAMTGKKSGFIL